MAANNVASIRAAYNKFEDKYREAVYGNDMNGNVSGTLARFLQEVDLSPYYKMKAYIALSAADEEDGIDENITACSHYLKKAEEALKEAKEVYKVEEDVQLLTRSTRIISEEWDALRERKRKLDATSDSDSDAGY